MFGHDSLPTRNWVFGAMKPHDGLQHVFSQFDEAHKYRNKLVELELHRRDEVAKCTADNYPEICELTAECVRLKAELETQRALIKSANAAKRKKVESKPLRDAAKVLSGQLGEARIKLKVAKAGALADPEHKSRLQEIDERYKVIHKETRSESPLYWGTKAIVEQSCSKIRKGAPPKFKRWDPTGTVAVQTQGGLSIADACSGVGTLLRIIGTGSHREIWLRVDSQGRSPVWAKFNIVLHREFPEDAVIKWAYLHCEKVAHKYVWKLRLALAREEGWAHEDASAGGVVGIDFGWRLVEGGLRVAYWVGDDGESGELILPHSELTRWKHAEGIRSIRDKLFDGVREVIACWRDGAECPKWLTDEIRLLRGNAKTPAKRALLAACEVLRSGWPTKPATIPESHEWLSKAIQSIRLWRSPERLANLIGDPKPVREPLHAPWRFSRFGGDELIFNFVEAWRRQNKHLYEWEACQRQKAIQWRKDVYRNFVADMRRRYRVAAIENTNWAKLMRLPTAEKDTKNTDCAREYQRVASVGKLAEFIRESMTDTVRCDPKHTTQMCHQCGHINHWDTASAIMQQCEECGIIVDQDENAARNLLKLASGPVATETP